MKEILHNNQILLEGVKNFRDMGGYISRDGRKVKKGLFFRSGAFSNITDNDKKKLKELGVKYIFDYRGEDEFNNSPTPVLEGIINERIPAMPDLTQNIKFGTVAEMVKAQLELGFDGEYLKKKYYNLPINNPSYKRLVEIIQNEENLAIVHHCSAGKDRTGVGAALILMILGVPKETIIADYMWSNEALKDDIEEIMKEVQPSLKDEDIERLNNFIGVNLDFIEETFKAIESTYGNIDNYLEKEFGLTKEKLAIIRDTYLE